MTTTAVFEQTAQAWLSGSRYVSSCGGTRSGKTYSILQLLIIQLLGEEKRGASPTIVSVVSETMPHLKRGCIRDFRTIMQTEGIWDVTRWSETEKSYTFGNGSLLEFFSVDNAGKVYGASRDVLFVNECQHIEWEIARQLFVRTRGRIIIDYNPTHEFWANLKVESKDNCKVIHSTYRDNGFLSVEQIREIEDNKGDSNWWRVFGEGKVGSLDGLIYDFDLIDAMPPRGWQIPEREKTDEMRYADSLTEIQGLDFGFSNDPTARVQVYADAKRKALFVRERCYRTHLLNRDIVADLDSDKVGRRVEIFADCAEPKSIAEIAEAGYNVIACDKDAPVKSDKRVFQIQWLKGWKLHVTKDSLNLIHELRNYTWVKDKDGTALNEPIGKFDHLLDALRYAVWSKFGQRAGEGSYVFGFNGKRKERERNRS